MSLFVEVNSVEKGCPVIINLEQIVEIAPLASGGCAIFFSDGAGMNSKMAMRVTNEYGEFKQFVMQTVSADDIAKRFPKKKEPEVPVVTLKTNKKTGEFEVPKFGE
jgi:hypothetical protein